MFSLSSYNSRSSVVAASASERYARKICVGFLTIFMLLQLLKQWHQKSSFRFTVLQRGNLKSLIVEAGWVPSQLSYRHRNRSRCRGFMGFPPFASSLTRTTRHIHFCSASTFLAPRSRHHSSHTSFRSVAQCSPLPSVGTKLSATNLQQEQQNWRSSVSEFEADIVRTSPSRETLIDIGRQTFCSKFDFSLDDWQLQAGGAIAMGYHVIVCSPTGSGKTVVGEMALHHALCSLQNGQTNNSSSINDVTDNEGVNKLAGIYTTPLKALSNQKYNELCATFGRINVGLSTGDVSINKDNARITVMTTEVYRNIAWRALSTRDAHSTAGSSSISSSNTYATDELANNAVVVLDEFHYMGLVGRGGVWEESVITSPPHTQIVALSATLSNAPSLAQWMQHATGNYRKTLLVEVPHQLRPVPLRYLYATRDGLFPLFRDPDAGPGAPHGLLGYNHNYNKDNLNDVVTFSSLIDKNDKIDIDFECNASRAEKMSKVKNKAKKTFGFGDENARNRKNDGNSENITKPNNIDSLRKQKLPRGLQVNPSLRKASDTRTQRVMRELKRQQLNQQLSSSSRKRRTDHKSASSALSWNELDDDFLSTTRRTKSSGSSRSLSPKQLVKERERLLKKELRQSIPSLYNVMIRLKQKKLLPAIFFIFSRLGCDEAAKSVCRQMLSAAHVTQTSNTKPNKLSLLAKSSYLRDKSGRTFRTGSSYVPESTLLRYEQPSSSPSSSSIQSSSSLPLSTENWEYYAKVGLLQEYQKVQEVAIRLSQFNYENEPEIAFNDETIERFLLGVASHHAGMLPSHKSFVEALFRAQLLYVVFATETLAAGINMPARTTVLCALAKPSGSNGGGGSTSTTSMRLLETHAMLQMAGRAGRRGMDTDGTCVIVASLFEDEETAAKILIDPVQPITSQFTPSYTLAVNLIQRDSTLGIAQQLIRKSFAMWQAHHQLVETPKQQQRSINNDSNDETNGCQPVWDEELLQLSKEANFMSAVIRTLQEQSFGSFGANSTFDAMRSVLKDAEILKSLSKSYVGLTRRLDMEKATFAYLQRELDDVEADLTWINTAGLTAPTFTGSGATKVTKKTRCSESNEDSSFFLDNAIRFKDDEQFDAISYQIQQQQDRINHLENQIDSHPFTLIVAYINDQIEEKPNDYNYVGATSYDNNNEKRYNRKESFSKTKDLNNPGVLLRNALAVARKCTLSSSLITDKLDELDFQNDVLSHTSQQHSPPLTLDELSSYVKSYINFKRKELKMQRNNASGQTTESERAADFICQNEFVELQQQQHPSLERSIIGALSTQRDSWTDFLAITNVLIAYGCIKESSDVNIATNSTGGEVDKEVIDGINNGTKSNIAYTVTTAGVDVGVLGMENSLWSLIALGGAWDVAGRSVPFRHNKRDDGDHITLQSMNKRGSIIDTAISKSQKEAEELVSLLRSMTREELAGYVSSIISEDSRRSSSAGSGMMTSIVDQFRQMTPLQQSAIQNALLAMDRFCEIQEFYSVDDASRSCNIDVSTAAVVTAWASGCSWKMALDLSGLPPGDLIRVFSRTLDALRQLSNVPYRPLHQRDLDKNNFFYVFPQGIHPDIRQLCRDAAKAINRYPVKDQFFVGEENDYSDDGNREEQTGSSIDENRFVLDHTNVDSTTDVDSSI